MHLATRFASSSENAIAWSWLIREMAAGEVETLADLEDRAALAAHLADKAAGRDGISLDDLDTALDRIDAATLP